MKTLNGKQGKSVTALLDCSLDRVKLLRAECKLANCGRSMNNMKLEIESDNSHVLGLVAKTFEIFSQCKGYPQGKGCHNCKYGYCKNPDTEPDLGCRIEDVEEDIAKFSF